MKKITVGILTFPNSPSFGASLQMLGLCKAITDLGFQTEIINYTNRYMQKKEHIHTERKTLLKAILSPIHSAPSKIKFHSFEKTMPLFPAKSFCDRQRLADLAHRYDYLVCGSDQVWNPLITNADMSYFLDFCNDANKKVAYAPSFGLTELPPEHAEPVARALKDFAHLSVREMGAKDLVKQLSGRDCPVVVDPSMLVDPAYWKSIAKRPRKLPERYIAKFIFNPSQSVDAFIDGLHRDSGLPVLEIGGGLFSPLRNRSCTGALRPDEWLSVIDHADYVVTDSFHGAAFSLIFGKELFISMASSTNSRLLTLSSTFQLEDHVLHSPAFSKEARLNYSKIHEIMRSKRAESLSYLQRCLSKEF